MWDKGGFHESQGIFTETRKYLKNLPKEDFQDTLDYFNEYFDEKENDEQAIQELGSPKEAAHEILANLYDKEKTEDKPNTRNMVWLTILSILAAPIGVPLAITLVALFITLLLIIFSLFLLLISLWIVLLSLAIPSYSSPLTSSHYHGLPPPLHRPGPHLLGPHSIG